jgi:ketosteroid isomerase-like protein
MSADDPRRTVERLFAAYAEGDRDRVRRLLAGDLIAYVTNAEAGVDELTGADEYMSRLPDLEAAGGKARVTQTLAIDQRLVMTMVEITAQREGRKLHNHAAFLAEVEAGRVRRLWMVDALPSYSDEFWA